MKKSLDCDQCPKKLSSKSSLRNHIKTAHEKPYKCPVCHLSLKGRNEFIRHKQTHVEQRDFICEICQKRFGSKEVLNAHKEFVHATNRPYECEQCEATYKEKYSLTRHIKRTHDVNYVTCDLCEKKFNDKTVLLSHIIRMFTLKKKTSNVNFVRRNSKMLYWLKVIKILFM